MEIINNNSSIQVCHHLVIQALLIIHFSFHSFNLYHSMVTNFYLLDLLHLSFNLSNIKTKTHIYLLVHKILRALKLLRWNVACIVIIVDFLAIGDKNVCTLFLSQLLDQFNRTLNRVLKHLLQTLLIYLNNILTWIIFIWMKNYHCLFNLAILI